MYVTSLSLRIRFFTSAVDAIRSIEASPPQVIICDIMMPEMSGFEAYREFKSLGLANQTLLITGGSTSNELRTFIEEESPAILYKPFSPKELRSTIAEFYQKSLS